MKVLAPRLGRLSANFCSSLRELLVFFPLLDDLGAVLRRVLVFGGVAQKRGELRLVGDGVQTMVDPAIERVPLILRLEDRFAAVGEIALLVIFERRVIDRVR